jgi:hypothetical protein
MKVGLWCSGTKVITSQTDCKYVRIVDGEALNEIDDCTMEGWRRQRLMVSGIVFWCSFSNVTISETECC